MLIKDNWMLAYSAVAINQMTAEQQSVCGAATQPNDVRKRPWEDICS